MNRLATRFCTQKTPNIKSNGISLLEVPIAVALILSAFLIMLSVYPVSYQGISKGKDILNISWLCKYQIEKVKTQPFGNGTIGVTSFSSTSVVNGVTSTTKYLYSVTVTSCGYPSGSCPYSGSDTSKPFEQVTVNVWDSGVDTNTTPPKYSVATRIAQ